MKVLIVAATELEINILLKEKINVQTLITGIGVPATMYSLVKHFQQHNYDLVIQAGIAGLFSSNIELGSTVAVNSDVFADLGVQEGNTFSTIFEVGFEQENSNPFTAGKLLNNATNFFGLPLVNAITVNTVSDNILQSKILQQKYKADIETMEGAAFHYVCIQEKINFLQVRSISNYVGDRNKNNWKIKEAVYNLNEALEKILIECLVYKN